MRNIMLLSLLMAFGHQQMQAQEQSSNALLQYAQASHTQFLTLKQQENADRGELFQALYKSYTDHMTVLDSTATNSADQMKAKLILREQIYPLLESGAIYYQKQMQPRMTTRFAQAVVDMPKHKAFENETYSKSRNYATLVRIAATEPFNEKQYQKAIPYLQEFVDICSDQESLPAFQMLAHAYQQLGEYGNALRVTERALKKNPRNLSMLQLSCNICQAGEDYDKLLEYALRTLKYETDPKNIRLLQFNIGKAYEQQMEFQKAIKYFQIMKKDSVNNIVLDHLATNYYNLAALHYNQNVVMPSRRDAQQAEDNYRRMLEELKPLSEAEPFSLRYNVMKANAYSCLGMAEELGKTNEMLRQLGEQAVNAGDLPNMVSNSSTQVATAKEVKNFNGESLSAYVDAYVKHGISRWQEKNEFESLTEWQSRVNQQTWEQECQNLASEATRLYLDQHMRGLRQSDFTLHPYDAENASYLLSGPYGDVVVKVPRNNREAERFKSEWEGMLFKNVKYGIVDGHITIEHVDVETPSGKVYAYDNETAGDYAHYDIAYNFQYNGNLLQSEEGESSNSNIKNVAAVIGQSDVDLNIPEGTVSSKNTYAFVIGNEHYKRVAKVPFAVSDAKIFAEYCKRTLGIPATQVREFSDATYMDMKAAIASIKEVCEAFNGQVNIIFYYAGHGVPNEADRSAYLLPTDVSSQFISECISVEDLYTTFNELGALSVTVFMDACFSGSTRGNSMLASARGVALRSTVAKPEGNIIAFSAATGEETAWPYNEKSHGLFSYFLLKKLQSTKGEVTLGELHDYITANVGQVSVSVNQKRQTPTCMTSAAIGDTWRGMKLLREISIDDF